MKNLLNKFHYCIYLMDRRLHYLSNYINPSLLLFRLPCVKKKYERRNQNIFEEYNKVFTDKNNGFSIWVAEGILMGVIFGILIGSIFLISRIFNFYENISMFHFMICAGLSMFICYLYVFKNDKYLDYFDQFEKWPKSQKRKYIIISFLVILASIAYFFVSLMCC